MSASCYNVSRPQVLIKFLIQQHSEGNNDSWTLKKMFISEEEIHRWLNIIVRETRFKVKFILSTLLQRYSTFYANDNQGNRVSDNKV